MLPNTFSSFYHLCLYFLVSSWSMESVVLILVVQDFLLHNSSYDKKVPMLPTKSPSSFQLTLSLLFLLASVGFPLGPVLVTVVLTPERDSANGRVPWVPEIPPSLADTISRLSCPGSCPGTLANRVCYLKWWQFVIIVIIHQAGEKNNRGRRWTGIAYISINNSTGLESPAHDLCPFIRPSDNKDAHEVDDHVSLLVSADWSIQSEILYIIWELNCFGGINIGGWCRGRKCI